MSQVKFQIIGNAEHHISKRGKAGIHLILDPDLVKKVPSHDWERGVYLFKSGNGYVVMAPCRIEEN